MFEVGQEKYQLPRSDVFKILRFWEHCRDHGDTPPGVDGMIVYRGRRVKVVDVRRHAGVKATARNRHTRIILLQRKAGLLGLLVDRVIAGRSRVMPNRWGVG